MINEHSADEKSKTKVKKERKPRELKLQSLDDIVNRDIPTAKLVRAAKNHLKHFEKTGDKASLNHVQDILNYLNNA
jgi:histidyl-tRNA synthetase